MLNNLESLSPPKSMKKKKPKKSKSPASKSASKPSASASPRGPGSPPPIHDSPSPIHDSPPPIHDSPPPILDSSSPATGSDALTGPIVDLSANPLQFDSDLASANDGAPSHLEVIVAPTDPTVGESEANTSIVSPTDKTVIADASADPSPPQQATNSKLTELSSTAAVPSSSIPPVEDLQALPVSLSLDSESLDVTADAEVKSSSSLPVVNREPSVNRKQAGSPVEAAGSQAKAHNISNTTLDPSPVVASKGVDSWCERAKGFGKRLSNEGEAFTLPSGEACIQIPNSIIEKHRKSWEPFVIGQFYSDPPSQGTLHNIVNGIWSKQYRDIAVSKMEGYAFLFRIPNATTRSRVIKQKLWQIEGQTMFVDKWEPGTVPEKPELTSAPIWLELRNVPLQFFNEDGLERIAGLVGQPKYLHPMTANKLNLEVAKVFTIIDPRQPLPEAVNVQFQSGEITRVLVSCPWMPPVCDMCKEVGHISKRCPQLPKACSVCKATDHSTSQCPSKKDKGPRGRKTRRSKSRDKKVWIPVDTPEAKDKGALASANPVVQSSSQKPAATTGSTMIVSSSQSKLGSKEDHVHGEPSGVKTQNSAPSLSL